MLTSLRGRKLGDDLDFVDWLQVQLNKRDWRQATLAKKGRINTGYLAQIMKRMRPPGPGTLIKIADALGIPREVVFSKFGYLSEPTDEKEKMIWQIQFNARELNLSQLRELDHFAAYLLAQRQASGNNREES